MAGYICYGVIPYAAPMMIAPIIISALFFALQHSFIPTLFDMKYIVYRFISFLPLTMVLCWYYYKKILCLS